MHVAIVFSRFGPYHVARLEAAGDRLAGLADVVGVEISRTDRCYDWDVVETPLRVGRETLFAEVPYHDLSPRQIRGALTSALTRLSPGAVALPGWSYPEALGGLEWCRRSGVPAILLSESTRGDARRRAWREALKRRIVRRFSAAVVGGTPHVEYVCELGMPRERVFTGYDVVDNRHFAMGAEEARARGDLERQRYGLPPQYFMASSRFLPKKNLQALVRGYSQYLSQAGKDAWRLVLCGSGPEGDTVKAMIARLGIGDYVMLPGFIQYAELPSFYGLASAFVHASTTEQWGLVVNEAMAAGLPVIVSDRCGCASDLVKHGVNGYSFDPKDDGALAAAMLGVASEPSRAAGMADASRRMVAQWGPERFGEALRDALDVCLRRPSG